MTPSKSLNQSLSAAKSTKQDEFYTQYVDIQKEVEAYLEFDEKTFSNKVIYCNCDDPLESNFFKYFAANFNRLGLKKLISTSYDGSPIAGQGDVRHLHVVHGAVEHAAHMPEGRVSGWLNHRHGGAGARTRALLRRVAVMARGLAPSRYLMISSVATANRLKRS